MVGEFVAAALAVISALKKNRDNEIAQQYSANDAEQQLWDQRNAAMQAKIDRMNGVDPSGNAFKNALDGLHLKAMNPVSQDWTPLVGAVGKGASAIYKEGQRDRSGEISDALKSTPTGEDVPGENYSSPASSSSVANPNEKLDLSTWEPVRYDANKEYGSEDEDDSPRSIFRRYR